MSDNFVYYNKNYDNIKGAYDWCDENCKQRNQFSLNRRARKTLTDHKNDKRDPLYSEQELENGSTTDGRNCDRNVHPPVILTVEIIRFMECRTNGNGPFREDARVLANVLGQENPREQSEHVCIYN